MPRYHDKYVSRSVFEPVLEVIGSKVVLVGRVVEQKETIDARLFAHTYSSYIVYFCSLFLHMVVTGNRQQKHSRFTRRVRVQLYLIYPYRVVQRWSGVERGQRKPRGVVSWAASWRDALSPPATILGLLVEKIWARDQDSKQLLFELAQVQYVQIQVQDRLQPSDDNSRRR